MPLINAGRIMPGLAVSAIVGAAAFGVAAVEERAFGHAVVEGLVVAIILGILIRTMLSMPDVVEPGVDFAAKEVLELAVCLLGVSVDLPLLLKAGPALAVGIVALVVVGLSASYAIGRMFGLPKKLSILVACGNAICGNSAIAAVAPVIGAEKEHVASAIAFTAILGVFVVIALPFAMIPLGFNEYQYGVLTGLTVYAVPQVLAAAFPVSVLSGQVGTLVKLVRVLMLGPVVLFFALRHREPGTSGRLSLTRFVPWFIVGFLLLAALRSSGVIPEAWVAPTRMASSLLTILAMAALGLGVDLKSIRRVGGAVMLTVTSSLAVLVALSVLLIRVLGIH